MSHGWIDWLIYWLSSSFMPKQNEVIRLLSDHVASWRLKPLLSSASCRGSSGCSRVFWKIYIKSSAGGNNSHELDFKNLTSSTAWSSHGYFLCCFWLVLPLIHLIDFMFRSHHLANHSISSAGLEILFFSVFCEIASCQNFFLQSGKSQAVIPALL